MVATREAAWSCDFFREAFCTIRVSSICSCSHSPITITYSYGRGKICHVSEELVRLGIDLFGVETQCFAVAQQGLLVLALNSVEYLISFVEERFHHFDKLCTTLVRSVDDDIDRCVLFVATQLCLVVAELCLNQSQCRLNLAELFGDAFRSN